MFVLSKLFTYLFLPPGIFILALFIAAFLVKRGKLLLFTIALLFYLLSTKFIANALLLPLEDLKNKDENASVVVVLGGGVNNKDYFKATNEAFKREVYAFFLAKEKKLPLVFCGGGFKGKEAHGAKKDFTFFQKRCESNITIYYESNSLNTKENALFCKKLFEKEKLPKKIYLVTSAYHMLRARYYFSKAGFFVVAKPSNFYYDDFYTPYDFLPQMKYLNISYKAIHEYIGLIVAKNY